jgi:hypothetical protein
VGSTKRFAVLKWLGDWEIGLWGLLEGGGCCIGKELVLETLAEEKFWEVMRLKVDGSVGKS